MLTAPHLAWLARQEAGYQPLLKYAQPVHGLLVVKSDSSFDSAEALRGHTIATADPIAVAVMAIQAEMSKHGHPDRIPITRPSNPEPTSTP